jgi:hypothetical protein
LTAAGVWRSVNAAEPALFRARPLPGEHVVEVFGDDEERFLAELDGEIVGVGEAGVGREEVGGVDDVGGGDLLLEDGADLPHSAEGAGGFHFREAAEGDGGRGGEGFAVGAPGGEAFGGVDFGSGDADGTEGFGKADQIAGPEAVDNGLAVFIAGEGDVGDE